MFCCKQFCLAYVLLGKASKCMFRAGKEEWGACEGSWIDQARCDWYHCWERKVYPWALWVVR